MARGTLTAPPSKSYTHRAMVLGALTHSQFALRNALISDDTRATLDALLAFGAEVRSNSGAIKIFCEGLRPSPGVIDARNSGTTIRLLTGLASLLPSATTLTGDDSLVKRPMGPLVDALRELGAECSYLSKVGCPPLKIRGPIVGQKTRIPADISSQFVSSLLIACTQKPTSTEIQLEGELRSKPYVDITIQMLKEFGGDIETTPSGFKVQGAQHLAKESYSIPGDYSSASFPLTAAAVTGGEVTVRNLDQESPQGDRAIVEDLKAFGAKVSVTADQVKVSGGRLRGTTIDVRDTPDLFPILAVIGCVAEGKTVLKGGENLRHKESDRIATTTNFLSSMGARILPKEDGCEILGGEKLHGATIQTEDDHRILMAASVAALVSTTETKIDDDDSFKISYPGFLRDMHQIGCRLEVRK